MAIPEGLDQFIADSMSGSTSEAPETESAPTGATATHEEVAPESEDTTGVLDDAGDDRDTFDRAYVQKLRSEAARYRERSKRYVDSFEGYEEEAVSEWLNLAKNFREDPAGTAKELAELSAQILKNYEQEEQAPAETTGEEEDRPLTMSEYRAMRDKENQESQRKADVARIEGDAKALGYDLKSVDYKLLLLTAKESSDGSLQKAHEMIQANRQAQIDAYIAEKAGQSNTVQPAGSASVPPSQERQIRSFDDARKGVAELLAAQWNKE